MNTLKFSSQPENIAKVESYIEELQANYNVGEDAFGNILISVTEAANNAILHGNGGDASKEVEIWSEPSANGKSISIFIKDQGNGFDYSNLPDPTAPENLEKASGRGVFLMMQLADLVIFSNNGSTVELQFRV